jgi:hypothetical protein
MPAMTIRQALVYCTLALEVYADGSNLGGRILLIDREKWHPRISSLLLDGKATIIEYDDTGRPVLH